MNNGDYGSDVSEVQKILVKLGYSISDDELDSRTFGGSTHLSVICFQQSNSLEGDGIVGPNTLNALKAEVCSRSSQDPVISVDGYIQLLCSAGVDPGRANAWGFALYDAMSETGIITNKNEVCSLTANVLHETGQLTTFTENLNYSNTALRTLWPTHFSRDEANQYGRTASQPANQKMIANLAYADRMGNGGPETGDGWLRRGQGPFQLTGTDNHKAFTRASGIDVMSDPVKLTQVVAGSKSAIWFWNMRKCGPLARDLDHRGVCLKINGGENGLKHRASLTEFFLSKM